jgi:uncharacterized protein YycO
MTGLEEPNMNAPLIDHGLDSYQVRRYGPDQTVPIRAEISSLAEANPPAKQGDFILTHSSGVFSALIRFGQGLRYWGSDRIFAHWSHAAIFVNDDGDIVEALGGGVQKRNISVYRATEYVVVHLPQSTSDIDRRQAVKFAWHCLREKYGWLTIVSIAVALVSGTKLNFVVDGQQICSALVARCIERIGEIFTENEPWHLMPADLAKHFRVTDTGPRGNPPPQKAGVSASSKPGGRQRLDRAPAGI